MVVPDVSWPVYETWVDSLPESTPVRMAYDGRDLEIMTKGPDHEDYRQLLGHLVVEIARSLKLPLKGLGETTWKRSEIQRGIEADQSYGMVQILGFSGNSTDRPHASTVEVLSVVGPMAGSGTLVAVKAQYV